MKLLLTVALLLLFRIGETTAADVRLQVDARFNPAEWVQVDGPAKLVNPTYQRLIIAKDQFDKCLGDLRSTIREDIMAALDEKTEFTGEMRSPACDSFQFENVYVFTENMEFLRPAGSYHPPKLEKGAKDLTIGELPSCVNPGVFNVYIYKACVCPVGTSLHTDKRRHVDGRKGTLLGMTCKH